MSEHPARVRFDAIDGYRVDSVAFLDHYDELEPGEYVAIPASYWDRAILIPLCRWEYLRDVLRDAAAQLRAQCFTELAEDCDHALEDIRNSEPPRLREE